MPERCDADYTSLFLYDICFKFVALCPLYDYLTVICSLLLRLYYIN